MNHRSSRHRPRPIWFRHRTLVEGAAAVLASLVVASFLYAVESRAVVANGELRVWFFDIGQGDATFIETPDGHQILIDGGPDDAVLSKLGETMWPWDRTIDVVVATHPDADHIRGLSSVLERYRVGRIVWNGDQKSTGVAAAFFDARDRESGAAVEVGRRGHVLAFGDVTLTEVWPDDAAILDDDTNVASVVYRLDYGQTSLLLTGDATEAAEQSFQSAVGDIDVLKAGHHGSATSSGYGFLRAVTPEIAVISCGLNNRYGHPHPAVLARFADLGMRVLRTDFDGDILLTSDGGEPVVRPSPLPF